MCKKVESPKAEIASVLGALSVQVLSNLAAGSESTLGKVKEYYSVHHNHLPTGVEFFDGLCSGGLYDGISILAGVPNCGKTTLLVQVALSLSAKGIPVVFVSKDMKPEEQENTRKNLLKYCELDTYAMVKVWEKLKEVTQ